MADFQQKLMRKIYMIWFVRRVLPVAVFEALFIALGLHLFSRSVFVARVLQNAAAKAEDSPFQIITFLWSALWNARVEVKLEIAIAVVFGALFLWGIKRAIVSYEMLRRTAMMAKKAEKTAENDSSA